MSVDTRIGLAGLIVAFLGIAAMYLWPDKRWIGWICLGVAALLLTGWVVVEVRQRLGNSAMSLFLSVLVGAVFGGGGAALIWFNLRPTGEQSTVKTLNDESRTRARAETKNEGPKTLHDYFLNDFERLLSASETRHLTFKTGETVSIESKLYMDFDSKSEFVAFFIPDTHWTYKICEHIAKEGYKTPLKLTSTVAVESKAPGDRAGVSASELKFSGAVFIYHLFPLFDSDIELLRPVFKKQGLTVQFRGTHYEFERNNPPSLPFRIPAKPN